MRPRCLAVGILVLVFGLATPSLAQGGPPAHAGQGGPPDHAASGAEGADRGPPAHAGGQRGPPAADDGGAAEVADGGGTTEAGASGAAAQASDTHAETTGEATRDGDADATKQDVTEAAETGDVATTEARPSGPAKETTVTDTASTPLVLEGSSSGSVEAASAGNTEAAPGLLAGVVPGLLLGAVGVLALAVHVGAPRRDPVRPPRGAVDEADPEADGGADEAEPDETGASEPDPAATEGGVVGVITLGQEALDAGDVEAAAGWFETATELAPRLQVARFCLGMCLDELGRLEGAEDELRRARRLEDDPMARYAHASVLARLGRTREAVEILERLTSLRPELRERLREDEDLANLRDHPRFLALLGDLPGS